MDNEELAIPNSYLLSPSKKEKKEQSRWEFNTT